MREHIPAQASLDLGTFTQRKPESAILAPRPTTNTARPARHEHRYASNHEEQRATRRIHVLARDNVRDTFATRRLPPLPHCTTTSGESWCINRSPPWSAAISMTRRPVSRPTSMMNQFRTPLPRGYCTSDAETKRQADSRLLRTKESPYGHVSLPVCCPQKTRGVKRR